MSIVERRQRQVRQRDDLILSIGRKLLLEQGFQGLTMERIATAAEYSKGTIYQHYKSKEDVLTALAASAIAKEVALFERAASFSGRPRERIAAIGVAIELYERLHPDDARIDRLLSGLPTLERAQPERRELLAEQERQLAELITTLVKAGIQAGDLSLPEGGTVDGLAFGLWSLTLGAASIDPSQARRKLDVEDPTQVTRMNCHRLLDGYGFEPLSGHWDWAATYARIDAELFSEEVRRLRSGA